MARMVTFKKQLIGVGVLAMVGMMSSTFVGEISHEGVSSHVNVVISAETQKEVEKSLVGNRKKVSIPIDDDGHNVVAERVR
jgi:hypothetical protein